MGMIISRIVLDLHAGYEQASISIKAGDTGRSVSVRLTENGVPFIPKNGYFAVITVKKPDGTVIYNDCTIYGDGRIEFTVTSQFAAAEGVCNCELRIYNSEGELVISPRFTAVVYAPVLSDSAVESSSEFTALTQRLIEADNAISEANEAADAANSAANTANEAAAEAFAAAEGVIYLYATDSDEAKMQKIGAYFTNVKNGIDSSLIYTDATEYAAYTCKLSAPMAYEASGEYILAGSYEYNTVQHFGVNYVQLQNVTLSGNFTVTIVDNGTFVFSVTSVTTLKADSFIPQSASLVTFGNTAKYVPTEDYNPATKKYVDDTAALIESEANKVIGEMKDDIEQNSTTLSTIAAQVGTKASYEYVDDEIANKAVAKSTVANMLYGRSNGAEFAFPVSTTATAWNIPRRNGTGHIISPEPTEDNHVATKQYVEGSIKTRKMTFSLGENINSWYSSFVDASVTKDTVITATIDTTAADAASQTAAATALSGANVLIHNLGNNGSVYVTISRFNTGIDGCMAAVSGTINIMYKG